MGLPLPRTIPIAQRGKKGWLPIRKEIAAAEPTSEPAQLKAGRAASRGLKRGQAGGLLTPGAGNPRQARASTDGGSIEPPEAGR